MTEDRPTGTRQRLVIVALFVVVAVFAAVIAYFAFSDDSEPGAVATTTTTEGSTTTSLPATTTTTVPPTTTTTLPPVRVFTFAPEVDISVASEAPEQTFADEPVLVADEEGDLVERALVAFQVEGLPADLTHMRATLQLTILDSSDREGAVSLADGEWDDSTTWSTSPAMGNQIAVIPVVPEGSFVELDVTEAVVADGRLSFYLTVPSTDDLEFASSESGADAPLLVITVGDLATGPPPLLVGAGDIASCESPGDEATADLIEDLRGDRDDVIVFTVGDSVYDTGTMEAYQTCYEPSWGRFLEVTRPAPGSRDYAVPSADGYYAYFGDRAGGEADGYYSYHQGAWRVFVLNSNCERIGGCGEGSAQYEWFVSQLEATEAVCVAAYWQRPLYSSGTEGTDDRVAPMFEAAAAGGVDVLINGNDHLYERFAPRDAGGDSSETGMRQFIVGTGGRSLDAFGPAVDELSEFRYNEAFGVLRLELFTSSYRWSFVSTEGVEVDAGSAPCN